MVNSYLIYISWLSKSEHFNPFHPEFMKWTFPSVNLDMSIVANRDVSQKSKTQNNKECRS